jgi:hypothetical protein
MRALARRGPTVTARASFGKAAAGRDVKQGRKKPVKKIDMRATVHANRDVRKSCSPSHWAGAKYAPLARALE